MVIITKKNKFIFIILCTIVVVGAIVYSGLPFLYVKHNEGLEKSINTALKQEGIESIDIDEYVNYNWEKAYIFHPYTSQSFVDKMLGPRFYDPVNISNRDDIELLVIVKEENRFEYAEIKRGFGEFFLGENFITPNDSTVEIIGRP